jgi:hypothetical protein
MHHIAARMHIQHRTSFRTEPLNPVLFAHQAAIGAGRD